MRRPGLVLLVLLAAAAEPEANLFANGGFEEWLDLDDAQARREGVQRVELVPPHRCPAYWFPAREAAADQGPTATVALDEQVRHGGARSVRITNRAMRDITLVGYNTERFSRQPDDPHHIRPNRRYQIRWWVKGQDVDPNGTGPLLMMFVTSGPDGHLERAYDYERTAPPTGTFDWQQRRFSFTTGPAARWLNVTLQLRWTTGTIWLDDAELLDRGPVVPVDTY